jgi:drug/metabolite transporter (DMT)-like permease
VNSTVARRGAASAGIRDTAGAGGRTAAGIAAGTAAGLVWGLAFLLPVLLPGWTAVTVTAGRYLVYGALSLVLLAVGGRRLRHLSRRHWRPALTFALTGNVGYYLLLVVGVQLAGAPATDIVIGCIPVTVALAGNVRRPAYAWRTLMFPLALVIAGLLIVDVLQVTGPGQRASAATTALGLLAALGAVALWTWYALANARFLSGNPDVPAAGWSTVVGLGTGVVTLAALPLAALTHQLGSSGRHMPGLAGLVGASLVLGVLVSWGGTSLWNLTTGRLPGAAAGMLISVETVAGFAYVYAARAEWPPAGQILGFALILAGVGLVVRPPARREAAVPGELPHVRSWAWHGR